MLTIKRDLVSEQIARKRSYGRGNARKYITVHQTANTSRGANAQAHANLQKRLNPRQCSWHWSVDDHEAIQSFSHEWQCWHARDGRGKGNTQSIGVEICINSDGDYKASVTNGAVLVARIAREEGIPLDHIVQHHHWSGKDCPHELRAGKDGITWGVFLRMVKEYYTGKLAPAPAAHPPEESTLYRVQVGAYKDKANAKAMSEKLQAEGYPVYVTGEGAKVEPAPEQAKAEQQAHFLKAEKATYIPYSVKNVRSAPSTLAEIVAQYPAGSHIAYDEVYEGDGYRWVSYIGRSGKRRYVACRKADGTALGDFR